ncbi:MAG: hypothetical protein ABJF10_10330 [Chthoniobacter sp.]|uniref:hypothetical protein n=1 Tax=Chthoniobacter sp. TaxID=2510640 RepID=UPI0032A9F566
MTLFRFSKAFLLAGVFLLAITTAALAGEEKQYPEYNIAVTPPEGWQDITSAAPQKGLIVAFGSADRSRAAFVLYDDKLTNPGELDDRFVMEFENAAETSGLGKRISGRFVMVQGIKSYERTGSPLVRGKIFSMISRTVPTRGRFFGLQGFHFTGGDAGEDPEIRQFMESFRFLTPPPSMVAPDPETARKDAEIKQAVKRGQDFGRAMGALFVPLLVIGAIVGIIWVLMRRGKSRPPQTKASSRPPPPPPLPTEPLRPPRATALALDVANSPPPPPPPAKALVPRGSVRAPAPPAPAPKPAPPAKEPPPPAATPPLSSETPPPPPKVHPPISSVIRPRQRHMRE